jgi:KipI family sensor histidine kinase inhibitor
VIRPFGEAALLVETADAGHAQSLAASLDAEPIPGVTAAVPAVASVLVEIDPLTADPAAVEAALATRLAGARGAPAAGRQRTIPVVYGGEWGPDLGAVAAHLGVTEADVVDMHAAAELHVLFDGFAPGFAYLGDLPAALRVPRLDTPRTRTPVGSVAIAGPMSGIYPADLPGGWRVIGRTPLTLFDPLREPPAYLVAGDVVRFRTIGAAEWDRHVGAPDDWA